MNIDNGNLNFLIDNVDKDVSYINIRLDKLFLPILFLINSNDLIEIVN